MKRLLLGILGATVVAPFMGCVEDPTQPLLTDVDRIQMSVSYTEILVGDSLQISARALDEQGNTLVLFPTVSSDATTVIEILADTIQTGKPAPATFVFAKALGFGTATLTATAGGRTATVSVQTWPAKVNVTAAPDTMGSGATSLLTAVALDQNGQPIAGPTAVVYTWTSDSPGVVAVDPVTGDATAGAPGIAVINVAVQGGASAAAPITVVPGTFGGTISATTGNPGETIDITRAGGGPIFDADTEVFFGGALGTQAFVDSFTDDVLTMVIPATGVAGTIEVLLTGMGPGQLAQTFAFTTTASLDDPYEPNDGPLAGPLLTNGTYYIALNPSDPDDFFTVTNSTGADIDVTVVVDWLTPADVDILWTDAGFTGYVGNFDGAGSSIPESSTVTVPAGTTWNLWVNLYTAGSAADNLKMTVTGGLP